MIKYALICEQGHEFEAWFSKMSDFDEQVSKTMIACPHCASTSVEKAIMAPNVSTSRKKDAAHQAKALSVMSAAAEKIRDSIAKNCDNVGDKFASEARSIHYGDAQERGIYGRASPDEARALVEEGIDIAPLPDALAPKSKTDVH